MKWDLILKYIPRRQQLELLYLYQLRQPLLFLVVED